VTNLALNIHQAAIFPLFLDGLADIFMSHHFNPQWYSLLYSLTIISLIQETILNKNGMPEEGHNLEILSRYIPL
jgi:hypothetical protein